MTNEIAVFFQDSMSIVGNGNESALVGTPDLRYFSILTASHDDYIVFINGSSMGALPKHVSYPMGVDIQNISVFNKSGATLDFDIVCTVSNIFDNRSSLVGHTIKTSDTTIHNKLDTVATAIGTLNTTEQASNAYQQSQTRLGSVVPLGKNYYSKHNTSGYSESDVLTPAQNTNGVIIRLLDMMNRNDDDHSSIIFSNGVRIGENVTSNRSTGASHSVRQYKNIYVPAGVGIKCGIQHDCQISMSYDILTAQGGIA